MGLLDDSRIDPFMFLDELDQLETELLEAEKETGRYIPSADEEGE